jgi:proline iminopeptidase
MTSAVDSFRQWRASLPRPPKLTPEVQKTRGLEFALYRTPAVNGATPLLCINGGLLFDHRLLWPALSPLAGTRQLIFYDQRGRGRTPAPPGVRAARIEHDALDAAAIAEALSAELGGPLDLLGHSWGGGIAMLAAAHHARGAQHSSSHHNAIIRRVVLINSVPDHSSVWLPSLTDRALTRLTGPAADRLRAAHESAERNPSPETLSEYSQAIYPAWFAKAELAAMFTPPRSNSVTGAVVSARLRREGYDWREALAGAADHTPTLLLHGDADLLPPSVADQTASTIGALARVVHILESGHNPFWEHPSIVFTEIERFLGDQ